MFGRIMRGDLEANRASFSVVVVHGLNFMNNSDHAEETWSASGRLWLKDLLPPRLPRPARIMLFAYNASPAMEAAAIKLDDHAKSLLQWLVIRRKVCFYQQRQPGQ